MSELETIISVVKMVLEDRIKADKVRITEAGYEVRWTKPFGENADSYSLDITCHDGEGIVNYRIENQTNKGFTIIPAAPATLNYTAVLIN